MTADNFKWIEESLTDEDKRLIAAYVETGHPVDDLAYTPHFDELVKHAYRGEQVTNEMKHRAFRRLLNLRKRGRLPRLVHAVSSSD